MAAASVVNPHSRTQSDVHVCAAVTEETPLIVQNGGDMGKELREPKDVAKSETLGYIVLLLAAVFFCLMALLTRYAGAYTTFSVPSMVFIRGLTQGGLSLISAWLFLDFREVFSVPRKYIPHVAARGICGAVSLSLNYKGLSLVPLGVTTCIIFLHPILTLILSSVVLGESVGVLNVIAAGLSFTGAVLVTNPTLSIDLASVHSSGYVLGILAVFISACMISFSIIIIRSMGTGVNFMTLGLVYSFFVTIVGIAMGGADIQKLSGDPKGLAITLAGSFFGFLAQTSINYGFARAPAGAGSVIRTIDVPLSFILALIFLHEVPHTASMIGSMLVVIGVGLVGLKKFRQK